MAKKTDVVDTVEEVTPDVPEVVATVPEEAITVKQLKKIEQVDVISVQHDGLYVSVVDRNGTRYRLPVSEYEEKLSRE